MGFMSQFPVCRLGICTTSYKNLKCGEHPLGCSVNARIGMTGSTGSYVYNANFRMAGHITSHELYDVLYGMFIGCRMLKLCPGKLA